METKVPDGSGPYKKYLYGIQSFKAPIIESQQINQSLTVAIAKEIFQDPKKGNFKSESEMLQMFSKYNDNDILSSDDIWVLIQKASITGKEALLKKMDLEQMKAAAHVIKRAEMEQHLRHIMLEDKGMSDEDRNYEAIIEAGLNSIYPAEISKSSSSRLKEAGELGKWLTPIQLTWQEKHDLKAKNLWLNFLTFGFYYSYQINQLRKALINGDLSRAFKIVKKTDTDVAAVGILNKPIFSKKQLELLIKNNKLDSIVFVLAHGSRKYTSLYSHESVVALLQEIKEQNKDFYLEVINKYLDYVKIGNIEHGEIEDFGFKKIFEWANLEKDMDVIDIIKKKVDIVPGAKDQILKNFTLENLKFWIETLGVTIPEIEREWPSILLHTSVISGNKELVEYVLSKEVDINRHCNFETPLAAALRLACKKKIANEEKLKRIEVIELLLKSGANPFIDVNANEIYPVIVDVSKTEDKDIKKVFIPYVDKAYEKIKKEKNDVLKKKIDSLNQKLNLYENTEIGNQQKKLILAEIETLTTQCEHDINFLLGYAASVKNV